jgi:hypothetical protein
VFDDIQDYSVLVWKPHLIALYIERMTTINGFPRDGFDGHNAP